MTLFWGVTASEDFYALESLEQWLRTGTNLDVTLGPQVRRVPCPRRRRHRDRSGLGRCGLLRRGSRRLRRLRGRASPHGRGRGRRPPEAWRAARPHTRGLLRHVIERPGVEPHRALGESASGLPAVDAGGINASTSLDTMKPCSARTSRGAAARWPSPMTGSDAAQLERLFKVIAHRHRIRILDRYDARR